MNFKFTRRQIPIVRLKIRRERHPRRLYILTIGPEEADKDNRRLGIVLARASLGPYPTFDPERPRLKVINCLNQGALLPPRKGHRSRDLTNLRSRMCMKNTHARPH